MQKVDGINAYSTAMHNPASKWPTRHESDNRLLPKCKPHFDPGFHLEPGESIFTIGSCFARHVERALKANGFVVPCLDFAAPQGETWGIAVSDILNKYTPHGMLNEVEFALGGPSARPPSAYLVEGAEGQFSDYQLHVNRPVGLERALQRRQDVKDIFRSGIRNSRVVIITLGLIESWWDEDAGIYLNETPTLNMVRKYAGRFRFEVLHYEKSRDAIRRLVEAIRDERGNDLKVMITVSPVPIQRTFTDKDVITANTYSKSVLRVVAEEISNTYEFVDYFPSYESITLSDPEFAWKDDLAHVTQQAVNLNIGRMVEAYAARCPAAV